MTYRSEDNAVLDAPIDVIRRRYDEFAPTYVTTWSRLEGYSALVHDFLARNVRPGDRVLDVGCGPGHLTAGLEPSVDVVGLDVSEGMLEQARAVRSAATYRAHDYHNPVPEEYGSFDVVLAVGSLDFCEEIALVLGHLAQATRPGGNLLVNVIERRVGLAGHEERRLPITPERMPGVDLVFHDLQEMVAAVREAELWPIRYAHYRGYRNQYHELDVHYAMWELQKPGP